MQTVASAVRYQYAYVGLNVKTRERHARQREMIASDTRMKGYRTTITVVPTLTRL
jgi:hypothetical protein